MQEKIKNILLESIETKKLVIEKLIPEIARATEIIVNSLKNGNKILICGNGGSAADAQHFVGELICTFENRERKSLPAISLNTNTSVITACANDFGFDSVFSRQVEGLGKEGDVLIGITTSGNSENVIKAFETAKSKGMKTICFNGKNGGKVNDLSPDINLIIPSNETPRIQEAHITIIHAICSLVEEELQKI